MRRFDKDFFDVVRKAQSEGVPEATYVKVIRGKLCISVIDTFTGFPADIILKGDPTDKDTPLENITVVLWTLLELEYFKRANRTHLANGTIQLYKGETIEKLLVNQVTDTELQEALGKPFIAVANLLKRFTSPAPVLRMLQIAEEMDVSFGYIKNIKKRLSELQAQDSPSEK